MIKAKDGEVTFRGVKSRVMAEAVTVLRALKETVSEEEYKTVIRLADKSEEQVKDETERTLMCRITVLSEESLFRLISLIAPSMTEKLENRHTEILSRNLRIELIQKIYLKNSLKLNVYYWSVIRMRLIDGIKKNQRKEKAQKKAC